MKLRRSIGIVVLCGLVGLAAGCGGGGSGEDPDPRAPSGLSYATNPAVYTKGVAITANTPSTSGGEAVTGYSVAPALPAGLSLSETTGVIAGTPTAIASAATYVVTASNGFGATTASLRVTVNAPTGHTISGTIWGASNPPATRNVQVDVEEGAWSAQSNADGKYALASVSAGTWTVIPSQGGSYKFLPASRSVTVGSADVTGVDFYVAPLAATGTVGRIEVDSSTMTIGGACVPFQVDLVNWTASKLTSVKLSIYFLQGGVQVGKTTTVGVTGCGAAAGELDPGACTFESEFCAASGSGLVAGPAKLDLALYQGSTALSGATKDLTLQ